MVDHVVDRGLLVLKDQIDTAAPGRRTDSDGFKGDAAHAARESQHNPESPPPPGNPDNQVDAGDFSHDPGSGADMGTISESIRRSRDRRVRYVIFNRRIFYSYPRNGVPAWTWQPYYGENPHDKHMHVTVNDVHHDETQPWSIGMALDLDQDPDFRALKNRVNALVDMSLVNPVGDNLQPEANKLAETLLAVQEDTRRIVSALVELGPLLTSVLTRLERLEGSRPTTWSGEVRMTLQKADPDGGS